MPENSKQDRMDTGEKEHMARNERISRRVSLAVSQSSAPCMVQVRLLWEDHFRVNVFVRENDGSSRIAHSFFLKADADGNILGSTPHLTQAN
jgi:hypothetical protein